VGLQANIDTLASEWRGQRSERQQRRALDRADFDALADAGFLSAAVPRDIGGDWESIPASLRGVCTALRTLATADPSVALVAAMHPAVLGYWLATSDPEQPEWEAQRRGAFETATARSQWGTITSEPGSGGDIMKTRTQAVPDPGASGPIPGAVYRLTGDKHFGSGFGISDFMFTTARADDEDAPTAFVLDMRPVRAGTAAGITVTAEWDGAGMTATQSHAARLDDIPATRLAWSREIEVLTVNAGPMITALFTAVVLGVFDAAVQLAREQLGPKRDGLRPYEQVEWTNVDLAHWTSVQAYEGALVAIESGDTARGYRAGLRAKTVVAEGAERGLQSLARVLGGGTFSRRSPISSWFEDVRALGFLRPPWGLAYDAMFATSFDA
jgi:alkylation response protein AidB-like acyl-CoA dehydrogenase